LQEFDPEPDFKSRFQEIFAEHRPSMNHIPAWLSWSLIILTLGVCILGSYVSFTYFNNPQPTTKPLHQVALDALKEKVANQPWMNVDQALENEVEKSRNAGRLKEAEGWDVRSADNGDFTVSFTFQEKDKKQVATWLVNPMAGTFVPQTDLALLIYKP
jgi:hypothetical protein